MAFILYYSFVIFLLLSYVFLSSSAGVRFYSFSNIFVVFVFLMVALPGYYVSNGTVDENIYSKFYRGMDWRLYWLYLFTIFSAIYGVLLGNFSIGRKKLGLKKQKNKNFIFYFVVIASIIYSVMFLFWVPTIPILSLLSGDSLINVATDRLKITHGLAELNPPFLFRYWRNVLQYFLPILFLMALAKRRYHGKKTFRLSTLCLFSFVSFCLVFTIEKASFIYFCISIFIILSVVSSGKFSNPVGYRSIIKFRFVVFGIIVCSSLILMYGFFMSGGGLESALSRIFRQTASNYIQILFFDEFGAYGIKGLDSRILGAFGAESLDQDYSQMAIQEMYPGLNDKGLYGAAGGMFGTNTLFIFGYYGLMLIPVYTTALGALDKVFSNTVFLQQRSEVFLVLIAFYAVFCSWYSMRALSSPFSIFSLDFIFNPSLLILIFFAFLFVRPCRNISNQDQA